MIALDPTTHDLYLDDDNRIARRDRGVESVAQRGRVRLRTHTQEWAWDQEMGLPYVEEFLVKNPDLRLNRARVGEELLKIEDVATISSVEIATDFAVREADITATARTIYGSAEVAL